MSSTEALARKQLKRIRRSLPADGSLPADEWRRRHRTLQRLLWVNTVALRVYGSDFGLAV